MPVEIFIPNQKQWATIKAALGIDATTLCQKIVIELDCQKPAKVFVQMIGPKRLLNGVLGLLVVEPVADVTVNEGGEVETKLS